VGRSPRSSDPSWQWGEAPFFPPFAERMAWSQGKALLSAAECRDVVARLQRILAASYDVATTPDGGATCAVCGYPAPALDRNHHGACPRCQRTGTT
jgi:hypothetical protein